MTGSQLPLWEEEDPPPDVFWCVPVDSYGRDLPAIAVTGADWKGVGVWGPLAAQAADRLGPDATLEELYTATTEARHLYYALTGDREKLTLELAQLGVDLQQVIDSRLCPGGSGVAGCRRCIYAP